MALLRLLQPYEGRAAGEEITIPGGQAATLLLCGVAVLSPARPVASAGMPSAGVAAPPGPGSLLALAASADAARGHMEALREQLRRMKDERDAARATGKEAADGLLWALEGKAAENAALTARVAELEAACASANTAAAKAARPRKRQGAGGESGGGQGDAPSEGGAPASDTADTTPPAVAG